MPSSRIRPWKVLCGKQGQLSSNPELFTNFTKKTSSTSKLVKTSVLFYCISEFCILHQRNLCFLFIYKNSQLLWLQMCREEPRQHKPASEGLLEALFES